MDIFPAESAIILLCVLDIFIIQRSKQCRLSLNWFCSVYNTYLFICLVAPMIFFHNFILLHCFSLFNMPILHKYFSFNFLQFLFYVVFVVERCCLFSFLLSLMLFIVLSNLWFFSSLLFSFSIFYPSCWDVFSIFLLTKMNTSEL